MFFWNYAIFFFDVFSKIYFIFSRSATKYLKIVSNWKFPYTSNFCPEVSFAAILLVSKSRAFQFPNSKTEAVVDDLGTKKISSETQKKTSILVKPHQLQGVFLANKPKRLCLICENVNFPATKISYFPWSYFFSDVEKQRSWQIGGETRWQETMIDRERERGEVFCD